MSARSRQDSRLRVPTDSNAYPEVTPTRPSAALVSWDSGPSRACSSTPSACALPSGWRRSWRLSRSLLRTDRVRLRPLVPDSPDTAVLRQAFWTRQDLLRQRGAAAISCAPPCCPPSPVRLACPAGSTRLPAWPSWPLRLPEPGRLAIGETAGCLAETRQLQWPDWPHAA